MKVVIGQGSCGIASGAKKTSDEFERLIAAKGISNVKVDVTGCIGTCYLEPIVDIYDDNDKLAARYVNVYENMAEDIVKQALGWGKPLTKPI